ncbi:hypothetical protein [Thermosynechococcus vestitus]|uniref:hypothetical protein n=1 Tax=Thermosynechococcus vestitus TaxID=146786 RepID=UPI0002E12500|nr:hypothetical protein [Thermosynechococcus vestitus]BAY51701.1 hypothetical protein NIES2134_107070 [Thermostichus vulcanus NIES-2134]
MVAALTLQPTWGAAKPLDRPGQAYPPLRSRLFDKLHYRVPAKGITAAEFLTPMGDRQK